VLAPAVAFVDLETTGATAGADRVTEIGIVRIIDGVTDEWSSLVNPGCSIPPEIQAMTGITNAMVANAPRFADIAEAVAHKLEGCIFIAHNARFDYGFMKHEFARIGRRFSAKVLCTVKLSRRLFPEHPRHNLDAIVERHALPAQERHRALGDARILARFVEALYRSRSAEEIGAAVARALKRPSLPPHLPPDILDGIPDEPGVYRFFGLNDLPIYIGKSIDLRERIGAHFSSDYRSANDIRLSLEVHSIEYEVTAGELGALLRESALVKSLLPSHNQRLRKRTALVALEVGATPGAPAFVPACAIDADGFEGLHGPFGSRRAAREVLRDLAAQHGLCWKALGLERRQGACFARQLRRCNGACVGEESADAHHARLRHALARFALAPWPFRGIVGIREASVLEQRVDVHVVDRWCWLGTASDEASLHQLVAEPPRGVFDLDTYRILRKFIARLPRSSIVPLS